MEHQEQSHAVDKVLAFDTIFTTNQIKIYKILLFYLDTPMQKIMAVYIKFMELQYTLSYFDHHHSLGINKPDFPDLCKEITPYCDREEKRKFEQLAQMMEMMNNFKQVSETMEMMKDLFPEGMPFSGFESGFNSSPGADNASGTSENGSCNNSSQLFEMLSAMMGGMNF